MTMTVKGRFRMSIIWVLCAMIIAAWLVNGVVPAGTWAEFLEYINVKNKSRFSQLAILGMVGVTVALIARILRKDKNE